MGKLGGLRGRVVDRLGGSSMHGAEGDNVRREGNGIFAGQGIPSPLIKFGRDREQVIHYSYLLIHSYSLLQCGQDLLLTNGVGSQWMCPTGKRG